MNMLLSTVNRAYKGFLEMSLPAQIYHLLGLISGLSLFLFFYQTENSVIISFLAAGVIYTLFYMHFGIAYLFGDALDQFKSDLSAEIPLTRKLFRIAIDIVSALIFASMSWLFGAILYSGILSYFLVDNHRLTGYLFSSAITLFCGFFFFFQIKKNRPLL